MLSKVDIADFVEISRALSDTRQLAMEDLEKVIAVFEAMQNKPRVVHETLQLGRIGQELLDKKACVGGGVTAPRAVADAIRD